MDGPGQMAQPLKPQPLLQWHSPGSVVTSTILVTNTMVLFIILTISLEKRSNHTTQMLSQFISRVMIITIIIIIIITHSTIAIFFGQLPLTTLLDLCIVLMLNNNAEDEFINRWAQSFFKSKKMFTVCRSAH